MDENLLKRLMSSDQTAFKVFYEDYIQKAFGLAVGILKDREMAKDAVQETFIRVYRYISMYDAAMPFDPWFYRILHNECMRIAKKEGKTKKNIVWKEELHTEATFDENVEGSELIHAIYSLKDSFRIPIVMKYLHGFSEKEIATIMNLNQNTVKSRLFHARKKLSKHFDRLIKEDLL
ncbi:RNA polymerase sigma-70 factor (ECF subfamily) [Cytobacillus eiseniae]|uniref:RNA polymerase sigma-70 factor (ECF subfamily) n=1 Tax=Cytobacillus eiseniae TaxID=762947 RepID=A0ABS4RAG4_9BACI|nr:RNA polymerase sigma factor [Cytobacillus eiseniae]MBP2239674.1 RNA polymerase sigma-70 factor (ECF subfamily) [Cytobacillus eiseniae]